MGFDGGGECGIVWSWWVEAGPAGGGSFRLAFGFFGLG